MTSNITPLNEPRSERRRYYRIHDDVALTFRVLDIGEVEEAVKRFENGGGSSPTVWKSLATINANLQRSMEQIRREHADIATALDLMNEKLETLERALRGQEPDALSRPTHSVSLSASGIAFDTRSQIPAGSLVELKLVIFPTQEFVQTLAAVVNCEWNKQSSASTPFRVAFDFSHITTRDREVLIRHIVRTQSEELRRIRGAMPLHD